jgi:Transglutaminase-like superfamily/Coenzyme PQQ synthesis protein D (PqqD)
MQRAIAALSASESEYVLALDVVLVAADDGSSRLLDLGGQFYAIPEVGTQMLQAVLRTSRAEAARRIADRYGVDLQTAARDLDGFLAELKSRGLIRDRGEPLSVDPLAVLSRFLLRPPLWVVHRLVFSLRWRAGALFSLARISFWCFGWAVTIRAWQRAGNPAGSSCPSEAVSDRIAMIGAIIRGAAASHWIAVGCKERALAAWSILQSEDIPATIVVGIDLYPLSSHCWCRCGASIVGDDPGRCELFLPVVEYVPASDRCASQPRI